MAKYKLQQNSVIDLETGMFIPNDTANRHWREYQEWLKEGNSPEPEFTLDELKQKKKSEIKVERYHQTFEDKNGFINDLCVLDLIFNYGPNAIDYLKRQACKPDSV
jgi:hypothetical protein